MDAKTHESQFHRPLTADEPDQIIEEISDKHLEKHGHRPCFASLANMSDVDLIEQPART